MTGWSFKIQARDTDLAQTVCVAIADRLQATIRALQFTDGVVVFEKPLSEAVFRKLRMKANDVKLI